MKRSIRKIISLALVALMVISSFATVYAADLDNHWAKSVIEQWIAKGYVSGYPDGSFKPDKTITRAEFVKMVNNAMGYKEEADITFNDVDSKDWYYKDVRIAKAAGYINGYSDTEFRPNAHISREQAAAIVARLSLLPDDESGLSIFTDANQVSDWAKGAVGAVAAKGFIKGYPDETFRPQRDLTRAEAIMMLNNIFSITGPMSIVIEGKKYVDIGSSTQYTAKVYDREGQELKDEKVTWSITKYDYVTISEEGKVTAENKAKEGKVTVTAVSVTNPLVSAALEISVSKPGGGGSSGGSSTPSGYSISINDKNVQIPQGGEYTFSYTAKHGSTDLSGTDIEWSITPANAGTLSENKLLLNAAVKAGKDAILVTAKIKGQDVSDTAKVEVMQVLKEVGIDGPGSLKNGETKGYSVTGIDMNNDSIAVDESSLMNGSFKWDAIDENGKIIDTDAATAPVTIKNGTLKACDVTAKDKDKNVYLRVTFTDSADNVFVSDFHKITLTETIYDVNLKLTSGSEKITEFKAESLDKSETIYKALDEAFNLNNDGIAAKALNDWVVKKIVNNTSGSGISEEDIKNGKKPIDVNKLIDSKSNIIISKIEPKVREMFGNTKEELAGDISTKIENAKTQLGNADGIVDQIGNVKDQFGEVNIKLGDFKSDDIIKVITEGKETITKAIAEADDAKKGALEKRAAAQDLLNQINALPIDMQDTGRKEELENTIETIDAKLAEAADGRAQLVDALNKIAKVEGQVNTLTSNISVIKGTMKTLEGVEVEDIEQSIDDAKEALEAIIDPEGDIKAIELEKIEDLVINSISIELLNKTRTTRTTRILTNANLSSMNIMDEMAWIETQVKAAIADYNENNGSDRDFVVDDSLFDFTAIYNNNSFNLFYYIKSINSKLDTIARQWDGTNGIFDEMFEIKMTVDATVNVEFDKATLGGFNDIINTVTGKNMENLFKFSNMINDVNTIKTTSASLVEAVREMQSVVDGIKGVDLSNAGLSASTLETIKGLEIPVREEDVTVTFPEETLKALDFGTMMKDFEEMAGQLNGSVNVTAKELAPILISAIANDQNINISIDKDNNALIIKANYRAMASRDVANVMIVSKPVSSTGEIDPVSAVTKIVDLLGKDKSTGRKIGDLLDADGNGTITITVVPRRGPNVIIEMTVTERK